MDYRTKETITFYRKGFALAKTREEGNITGDYDVLENTIDKDGIRTIKLKPQDKSQHIANVKELVSAMLEKMGEEESKAFRDLLEDTLVDYEAEEVERMLKKVKGEDKPVKARKGCFQVIIGDGRRKDAEIIQLRE